MKYFNFKKVGLSVCGFVVVWFFFYQIVIISIDGLFALLFPLSLWGLNTSKDQNWTKLIDFLDFVLKIFHDNIRDTSEL